ncbi:MAG TPA: hypothetical protein VGQ17_17270 [Gemmatimonadales bacterium]|jgi:hypothetical protein|nr:hypothetical protein [Gemmatimonadales bacterium]
MSDQVAHNVEEIERLLARRQELIGWLGRLDAAGARAPESVRSKVRADYRARLADVVERLRTHADLIESTLGGLLSQSRELRQVRQQVLEVRAEAELRHAVGEYTDGQWQLEEVESSGKIARFDDELERLGVEIHRLEEVQALIAPPTAAPAAPMVGIRPEPTHQAVAGLVVTHDTEVIIPMGTPDPFAPMEQPALSLVRDEPAAPQGLAPPAAAPAPGTRPEAPRFVPRSGAPRARETGPTRPIPFPPANTAPAAPAGSGQADELAFLRSVTVDATSAPARAQTTASTAEREERTAQTVIKTLKCGECGSMNRPTEWYCERCGAELAAV